MKFESKYDIGDTVYYFDETNNKPNHSTIVDVYPQGHTFTYSLKVEEFMFTRARFEHELYTKEEIINILKERIKDIEEEIKNL